MNAMKFIYILPLLTIGCLPVKKTINETPNEYIQSQSNNITYHEIEKNSVGCYYLANEFPLDGAILKSCEPNYIQSMIPDKYPFGIVHIWQFLNDHEIRRSMISSKTLKSHGTRDNISIQHYIKKGKIITITRSDGCELVDEIIEDKDSYIILKTKGNKNCNPGVTKATALDLNQKTKWNKVTN